MKIVSRNNGSVTLRLPDYVDEPGRVNRSRAKTRSTGVVRDLLTDALIEEGDADTGFELVDKFTLDLSEGKGTNRGASRAASRDDVVAIDVDLKADEQAAMLIEIDGTYEWHYPESVPALNTQNRSSASAGVVRFNLLVADSERASDKRSATRGGIVDFVKHSVFGKVKAFIFKFIARKVTGALTQKLEHSVVTGPKMLVSVGNKPQWKSVDSYSADRLPESRDAKVLLFVHGTFSSTEGSFGGLLESVEGMAFLRDALEDYDLVIGYDHYTLSETPEQNARQIFEKLQKLQGSRSFKIVFDAVAFSRGGLVLRTLTESIVAKASVNYSFDRCVMVGCTNNGTQLANEKNWQNLIDLYTNLAAGAGRLLSPASPLQTVNVVIQSIGSLVRHIVVNAVAENGVPGLAAMRPDGNIVKQLNTPDSDRTAPGFVEYYAIGSDFDAGSESSSKLGKRLLLRLGDRLIDKLMGEENDLVVNSDSMFVIDSQPAARLVERVLFSDDDTIFHTVYFFQPRVVQHLGRWLMGATRGSQSDAHAFVQSPAAVSVLPDAVRQGNEGNQGSQSSQSNQDNQDNRADQGNQDKKDNQGTASGGGRVLNVEVVWGDIRYGKGDVFCCGHYESVLPNKSEHALDTVVSSANWKALEAIAAPDLVLRQLSLRGLIRGAVGDVYFYPRADEPAKLVAVAGMGVAGAFTEGGLRSLARSLAWTAGSLPGVYSLSTVLIGSGTGALSITTSVKCLLEGMSDALSSGLISNISKIEIVELDLTRAHGIQKVVSGLGSVDAGVKIEPSKTLRTGTGGVVSQELAASVVLASSVEEMRAAGGQGSLQNVIDSLSLTDPEKHAAIDSIRKLTDRLSAGEADLADGAAGSGLTVEQVLDRYSLSLGARKKNGQSEIQRIAFSRLAKSIRVSAITDTAVIPQEEIRRDFPVIQELVDHCVDPAQDSMGELSYLLSNFLVPNKFKTIFKGNQPVVFDLDRWLTRVHWEMLSTDGSTKPDSNSLSCLGLKVPVARQLKTAYSPVFSSLAAGRQSQNALVIGDPANNLDGARKEALEVAKLLREKGFTVTLLIGMPNSTGGTDSSVSGYKAATRFEVLRLLALEKFSLLHYAGHGDFDADDPTRAGWVFGNELLTANELENLRNPPDLVVANACLSGRTSNQLRGRRETDHSEPDSELLATLADEFFKKGVRNYIGTAWYVDDNGAIDFAKNFYTRVLQRMTLGEALLATRKRLYEKQNDYNHLWAAYQHYGDPLAKFQVR